MRRAPLAAVDGQLRETLLTGGPVVDGFVRGPPLPQEVSDAHSGWSVDVAWQSVEEVRTYRLTGPSGALRFAKVALEGRHPSVAAEVARLRWALAHLPVPQIVAHGSGNGLEWMVTDGLPGRDGTDPLWKTDPERIVCALARGLRAMHETPVDGCPFDFGLETALSHARRRLEDGVLDSSEDFHPEHSHLSAKDAVRLLEATRPETETLVVCHGDYCVPNILFKAWEPSAFLDLGELGVADRWWDLAVATWTLEWNYGAGYEALFLEEYGVELDADRRAFYRLLYDVVS